MESQCIVFLHDISNQKCTFYVLLYHFLQVLKHKIMLAMYLYFII